MTQPIIRAGKILVSRLLSALLVAGCLAMNSCQILVSEPVVFAVGRYQDTGLVYHAGLWKDGQLSALPDFAASEESEVQALAVYQGNSFAAGRYNTAASSIPCYWRNTERTDLALATADGLVTIDSAHAQAIVVAGGVVYTAGYATTVTPTIIDPAPCLWTGTALSLLPLPADATGSGHTVAAYAAGDSVYVLGYFIRDELVNGNPETVYRYCYWKNGVRHDLELTQQDCRITGFQVTGGDIYFVGSVVSDTMPCYWKNMRRTDLPLPDGAVTARATAVVVSGGVVYTAGIYMNGTADFPCYWEGTRPVTLSVQSGASTGITTSISVLHGTVFVSGQYTIGTNNAACYWRNGELVNLPYNGYVSAFTTALVVQ